jgi:hypothetical protein
MEASGDQSGDGGHVGATSPPSGGTRRVCGGRRIERSGERPSCPGQIAISAAGLTAAALELTVPLLFTAEESSDARRSCRVCSSLFSEETVQPLRGVRHFGTTGYRQDHLGLPDVTAPSQ